jgi:hypothetical protein
LGFILRQAQDEVACFQWLSPHGEPVKPWATSFLSSPLDHNPAVWNCIRALCKSLSVSIICDLVIGAVQIVVF